MLAQRRGERLSLSAASMRSVLDGIASRLDESRELSRYMTGLLIFLGLLGTFWGLLLTIGSVSEVIGGMSVGSGDLNQLFNQLKTGLTQPLRGMGTAFASSMLGLSGALVLGFLDLTAGQALMTLTERLSVLTDQMRAGQSLMLRVAEQQAQLGPVLARLAEAQSEPVIDEATRGHLRNAEIYLARLLEEVSQGRAQATAELRSEIKLVARTIAALAEEAPR